jgi:beta-galactosidase
VGYSGFAATELRPWEDPTVFAEGQTAPHAFFVPFDGLNEAVKGRVDSSAFYLSLNGRWRFHWAESPENAPAEFFRPDFPAEDWSWIRVPSSWQMEGFGFAKFRNIAHPFPAQPPYPPSDFNPVGSYRRYFSVPVEWEGRPVYLHFEGVKSAARVWLNGRYVGYQEGGMEPAEFDVTEFVKSGENLLAVQVLRWSDGSYLEDQDMWRLAGIHRDVFLVSRDPVHILDYFVTTDLDERYVDATLRVQGDVLNGSDSAWRGRLQLQLYDGFQPAGRWLSGDVVQIAPGEQKRLEIVTTVDRPRLWSAEKPDLYRLVLSLESEEGPTREYVATNIGFREVEIRRQQILINGRPVKFNGVNSHMHHPRLGRAVDVETLRRDLHLMKQFNINLVRTSHYPPPAAFLDLADQIGMYVIDETNDEAHATEYLARDPNWREAYLNRVRRMVLRDRNHPSIVVWSAGNESGTGDNICAVIEEGRRLDPTRPGWMYGGNDDNTGDNPAAFRPPACETVVGPRYPTPRVLELIGKVPPEEDPRPSFMDEYIAATGNGLGGLDEYWRLIRRYPRLTGGAIWDWVSPGISRPVVLAPDSSPRGNAGALLGPAELVIGRFGSAVSLNGHDGWVEAYRDPSVDELRKTLTVDLWIYPRFWNGHGWWLNNGSEGFGLVQTSAEELRFFVGKEEAARVETKLPPDWYQRWHHVAGVYDSERLRLYLDGKEAVSRPCTAVIRPTRFPVNLGRQADLIGQEHPGYLSNAAFDRVRIFNRALTEAELFGETPVHPETALLWWEFDELVRKGEFYSLGIGGRSYGLVWPDRHVQPELWQLKKSGQPVSFDAVDQDGSSIRVENHFSFTDLSEMEVRWSLVSQGKTVEEEVLSLALPPGESKVVSVPFNVKAGLQDLVDPRLRLQVLTREPQAWAPAGHEIAWEEFLLNTGVGAGASSGQWFDQPGESPSGELEITSEGSGWRIQAGEAAWKFDTDTGRVTGLSVADTELLVGPIQESLFRAPVANEFERSWGVPEMGRLWFEFGLDRLERRDVKVERISDSRGRLAFRVEATLESPTRDGRFHVRHEFHFRGDGSLLVRQWVEPAGDMPPWLPRVGLEVPSARSLNRLTWYGRGPFETYPDRKTGARFGVYSLTVDEMLEPYLIPQDYGNRTDVRWAALEDEGGLGVWATFDRPLNVSLQAFSTDRLQRAEYPFQLESGETFFWHLDAETTGLGCTAVKVLEPYRVTPKLVEYRILLKPFRRQQTSPEELYRRMVE